MAKLICKSYPGNKQLLAVVKEELEKGHSSNLDDGRHVDTMAWFCKYIGLSGDPSFKSFLEEISVVSKNRKIRGHARKNADLL